MSFTDPFLKDLEDLDSSDSPEDLSEDPDQDDYADPNDADYSRLSNDPDLQRILDRLDSDTESVEALKLTNQFLKRLQPEI